MSTRLRRAIWSVVLAFGMIQLLAGILTMDALTAFLGAGGTLIGGAGLGVFRTNYRISRSERIAIRFVTAIMIAVFVGLIIGGAGSGLTLRVTAAFLALGFLLLAWFFARQRWQR